jgi:glycosyltransferase involved in cell wall biosynthesis
MGTATTYLALALAEMGHAVEVLLGIHAVESIDPYWEDVYARGGVQIRPAPPNAEPVEPWYFQHTQSIALGLAAERPDIVVAADFGAPAYTALRTRQAGVALEDSLFVVFCHGTRSWVLDMSRNLWTRDLADILAIGVLERACIELADVVVSPSAYLIDWMRGQGWRLPEKTLVIPYFTRPAAHPPAFVDGGALKRLAFFGRLDERKGVRIFTAGLNALERELLEGLDVEFLGKTSATWTQQRIEKLLSPTTRDALGSVSFQTRRDQHEALELLRRPGTIAVIPSIWDNSPNTVYECLESGIRFIASTAGGIPELVAREDRARVLFEPTPAGMEAALRRVLSAESVPAPARPAYSGDASLERWGEVVQGSPRSRPRNADQEVDVVVVSRNSSESLERCLTALDLQTHADFLVTVVDIGVGAGSVEAARAKALDRTSAPFVVFIDEDDIPEPELLTTLLRAQAASGADVVSCGLRLEGNGHSSIQLFSGEPGGPGVLANAYGTVALIRRSLLRNVPISPPAESDADWSLLAQLSAEGARVVSVPIPLVRRKRPPGSVEHTPHDALLVAQQLEQRLSSPLRSTARLAAGLAASSAQPLTAPAAGLRRRRMLRRLPRGFR